ncbi:hypothetical protein [Burkholderia stagnalis]
MSESKGMITTIIALTEKQRDELAKSLGISREFIPESLGVVGVPKHAASTLGFDVTQSAKFSPAIVMM